MTNKFKIGDMVRVPVIKAKRDANGEIVTRYNAMARCDFPVETKGWSDYECEVVAVPDGKKKRYSVLVPAGHTAHYGEKSLSKAGA